MAKKKKRKKKRKVPYSLHTIRYVRFLVCLTLFTAIIGVLLTAYRCFN
jgi:hypothetical protein